MSEPLFEIVEGTTEPQDAQLKLGGLPFNAAGSAIDSIVKDKDGAAVTVPTSWLDATVSKVRLSPTGATFAAAKSPYTIRYKITAPSGVDFFPPTGADIIKVNQP
jgi:hypothetical protein